LTAHPQLDPFVPFDTFLLCSWNVLDKPLLYLSYFFKTNRTEYHARLNNVRMKGEWEAWVMFFLRGVEETSETVVRDICHQTRSRPLQLPELAKEGQCYEADHPTMRLSEVRLGLKLLLI
jgi:Fic family protein